MPTPPVHVPALHLSGATASIRGDGDAEAKNKILKTVKEIKQLQKSVTSLL
jgi:hypothetical protein